MTDDQADLVKIFEQAWHEPGNTAVVAPSIDVNQVLADRYELDEPLVVTRTMLWDMEVRKASAPDLFIPFVVAAGSAECWGDGDDFVRISSQRRWLDRDQRDLVIERFHLDHGHQAVTFIGVPTVTTPEGTELHAGTGQPLFHVEHAVGGTETRPLNLWRIVHLTDQPDERLRAIHEHDHGLLPEYVEIYISDVAGRRLTRK